MNLEKVKKLINEHVLDAKITKLDCNYLDHEVEIRHEDEGDSEVVYKFAVCLKVLLDSAKSLDVGIKKDGKYIKAKELNVGQMECYLHSIEVSINTEDDIDFYVFKIDMSPTNIEIWCKNIEVFKSS